MRGIYLDYAATTPVDPAVLAAMRPYFGVRFGNPGSVHSAGQIASAALDKSRARVAEVLGADFRDIIFTASATEANNLALRGVVKGFRVQGSGYRPRIIVSSIEHESVLETAKDLEREGVEVVYIPVSREGFIDLKKLKTALNERTVLVSVMYASNEVGTVQPVAEIAEIVKVVKAFSVERLASSKKENALNANRYTPYPFFHTDAVQAFQYLPCDAQATGADLVTLSAHKLYGPKGVGVLYVGGHTLEPILTGGGQEFGYRSGTENVPLVVGAAEAIVRAAALREREAKRVLLLRDRFWKQIQSAWPGTKLNGGTKNRLPNNLNVWFPGRRAEDLLIWLDRRGIAVSSGTACSARSLKPSYVVQALGFSKERARESLRFTLGRQTAAIELARTANALKELKKIKRYR